MIKDKINFIGSKINKDITLELGCGNKKRINDSIGIDQLDADCVDIVGDITDILEKIPNDSICKISSFHVFEHIENLEKLISECSRVLKKEGILEIVVPHFSNPYFYSDYTHRRFFGLYSLSYFAKSDILKRRVPSYGLNLPLILGAVHLIFRGERPFYVRHILGKLYTAIFNSSNFIKELYEINLCYFFPCYEIKYTIIKK